MTLLPQSLSGGPENYGTMTDAAHTFAHYPLDPKFVETYSQKNYMSKYLDKSRE